MARWAEGVFLVGLLFQRDHPGIGQPVAPPGRMPFLLLLLVAASRRTPQSASWRSYLQPSRFEEYNYYNTITTITLTQSREKLVSQITLPGAESGLIPVENRPGCIMNAIQISLQGSHCKTGPGAIVVLRFSAWVTPSARPPRLALAPADHVPGSRPSRPTWLAAMRQLWGRPGRASTPSTLPSAPTLCTKPPTSLAMMGQQ